MMMIIGSRDTEGGSEEPPPPQSKIDQKTPVWTGLRVTGTDRKEMKFGLTEDKFCFVFDGVWEWFVFKAGISSRSITHRGIQGHFLSEVVFSWYSRSLSLDKENNNRKVSSTDYYWLLSCV